MDKYKHEAELRWLRHEREVTQDTDVFIKIIENLLNARRGLTVKSVRLYLQETHLPYKVNGTKQDGYTLEKIHGNELYD